ncbi:MAG: YkvA family protein [Adhaeribacter sp.]
MENQANQGKNIADSGIFKKILGKAEEYAKKPLRVKELLNDTYKKASEKKDLGTLAHEVWESLQTLSRLIKAAVTGEYTGIPTSTIVGGIAVLLYFLTPIDFVPDFIPVIGLLDDVALLAWFMTGIKHEMEKFEAWEKGNQAQTTATATTTATNSNFAPSGVNAAAGASAANAPVDVSNDNNNRNDPANKTEVKGFAAHDLPTEELPDDAAIRATSSGSGEPNVRAATTDSTRIPSSNADDSRAGGNVR